MNYKTECVDGNDVNFSSEWIRDLEKKEHFEWYYHQASIVYSNCTRTQKILEIGIGTGLLSDLLKKRGWNLQTLDIDSEKGPDFCGNAAIFDYRRYAFDVILAFEVFEHIPLMTFKKIIDCFSGNNVREVYFSLPWNERTLIDLKVKLAKLPPWQLSIALPGTGIHTHTHFWELGKKHKDFDNGKKQVELSYIKEFFSSSGYRTELLDKVGSIQFFSAKLID